MQKINQEGLKLIKKFEGFSPVIYICPAGYQTIGYGHRVFGDFMFHPITEETGEGLLRDDLITAERAVTRLITSALTDNQFSALASFVFNLGSGRLQSSTLRMKLNRGDHEGAAKELLRWTRGGGKILRGLVLRRQAEMELFLS